MSIVYRGYLIFSSFFLFTCAEPDPTGDVERDSGMVTKKVVESCISDFDSCQSTALLKTAEDNEGIIIQISAVFPDNTALSFNLKSKAFDIYQLAGDTRLNDTRTGELSIPWAVRVVPLPDDKEILWSSMGETVRVSFPAPDFIKIEYDISMFAYWRPELDTIHFKGEIVAPMTVRCYTEVGSGTGTGRLDPDFSSKFCSQYKTVNHVFESEPGISID